MEKLFFLLFVKHTEFSITECSTKYVISYDDVCFMIEELSFLTFNYIRVATQMAALRRDP